MTEEAARARVREIKNAGVDIVKARIENEPDPKLVAILAIVGDEARKQNIGLMVHATSPKAMVAAVKAGATKLVHTPHAGWVTAADAKVVTDAPDSDALHHRLRVPVYRRPSTKRSSRRFSDRPTLAGGHLVERVMAAARPVNKP
jgi:hypothetical protein